MTILSKLCILFHLKPAQLEMIHERRHMHTHTDVSCTHVSSCSLIITVRFSYICLRTISAITSRGEKLFQEGGSTVAPRLPEWGGEKRGEGGNRDVYSELNHWSLLHTALIFYIYSQKYRPLPPHKTDAEKKNPMCLRCGMFNELQALTWHNIDTFMEYGLSYLALRLLHWVSERECL